MKIKMIERQKTALHWEKHLIHHIQFFSSGDDLTSRSGHKGEWAHWWWDAGASPSRCIIKIPGIFLHCMALNAELRVLKKSGREWAGRSHQVWQEQRRRFILSCSSQPLTQHLSFLSFGLIYFNFYGGPLDLSLAAAIIWFETQVSALCTLLMNERAGEPGGLHNLPCAHSAVRDTPSSSKTAAVAVAGLYLRWSAPPGHPIKQHGAAAQEEINFPLPAHQNVFIANHLLLLFVWF